METCNASSCVGGVACGVGTTTARDGRRASGTAGGGGDSIRRAIVGTLSGGRGGSEGVAVAIEAGGSTGRISAEVAGVVSAGTGSVGAWAGPAATQRIAAWVIRSRDIVGSTAGKAANGANAEAGGAAAGDGLTSSTWGGNSALAGAGAITGAVLLETGCGATRHGERGKRVLDGLCGHIERPDQWRCRWHLDIDLRQRRGVPRRRPEHRSLPQWQTAGTHQAIEVVTHLICPSISARYTARRGGGTPSTCCSVQP